MTVASRTFASTPARNAIQTWEAIVHLLAGSAEASLQAELKAVRGIAASIITDQIPKTAPIVVTCDGPRTRIYCVYDDKAIEDDCNEGALGFDPLKGHWQISLPCDPVDLHWIAEGLAKHSKRVVARDRDDTVAMATPTPAIDLSINTKEFLAS